MAFTYLLIFNFYFKLDSRLIGIRLVAGNRYNSGTVEVYNGQRWQKICSQDWNFGHARVACRQLGFIDAQHRTQCCSNLKVPTTTLMQNRMNCTGNEPNLNDCMQINAISNTTSCNNGPAAVFCIGTPQRPTYKPLQFFPTIAA